MAVVVAGLGLSYPAEPAFGEQAGSATSSALVGALDAGGAFSCAILSKGQVRCWGFGIAGRLGYGNTNSIGDDETPDTAGPVDLGLNRSATSLVAGNGFTCAILNSAQVRCWGYGVQGQLGYGNSNHIGDSETPGSVEPVDLGPGNTATEITAGNGQTCVILNTRQVRCWGYAINGQLGFGNTNNIGDDELPVSVAPVNLGPGRTAAAISAGDFHTCAILDTGQVRCWGNGANGRLGYANPNTIGDDETPDAAGPVDLGPGRRAVAISAGGAHTCAILDTGKVVCWGSGSSGQLGYGNASDIGDDETPVSAGSVSLGPGQTAVAIAAGRLHTCAIMSTGALRCWGAGASGQLGYGNTNNVGDDEIPQTQAPVNLGPGRSAVAITAGGGHTCAALDTGDVRCWGDGSSGQLGYGNVSNIGDDEMPDSVLPLALGAPFFSVSARTTGPSLSCAVGTRCKTAPCSSTTCASRAVKAFKVRFATRSVGSRGQLVGLADVPGVLMGSRINVRCIAHCRLDHIVKATKRRGVRLQRRVALTPRSRIRVTISRTGRIARFKTYRFQRPKARYIASLVNSGCAADARGIRIIQCPPPATPSK